MATSYSRKESSLQTLIDRNELLTELLLPLKPKDILIKVFLPNYVGVACGFVAITHWSGFSVSSGKLVA
jgi:hypothetical protein